MRESVDGEKKKKEKEMEKVKVSVIVPVYNVDQYLPRAVDSIRKQTIAGQMEIILVDDGSTDTCPELCDGYARKYENVTTIHQQNKGVSAARNAGLRVAKGEYICFVDADDYVLPDMYETMLSCFKRYQVDFVLTGIKKCYSGDTTKGRKKQNNIFVWNRNEMISLYLSGVVGHNIGDKLFHRELLQGIEFEEAYSVGEDMYFLFEAICRARKVAADFSEGKYIYVQREGSAMQNSFSRKYFDSVRLSEMMVDKVKKEFPQYLPYAEAHLVHEQVKAVERMYLGGGIDTYRAEYVELRKKLRNYSLIRAFRYLSKKQFCGFFLLRISIKLYISFVQLLRI